MEDDGVGGELDDDVAADAGTDDAEVVDTGVDDRPLDGPSAVDDGAEEAGTRLMPDDEDEPAEGPTPDTVIAGNVPLGGSTAGGVRMMPAISA